MSRVIVDVNLLDAVAPAEIPQTIATLAAAISSLAARSDQDPPQRDRDTADGFLTIDALSERLGLAKQTIRNLVYRGELLQGAMSRSLLIFASSKRRSRAVTVPTRPSADGQECCA